MKNLSLVILACTILILNFSYKKIETSEETSTFVLDSNDLKGTVTDGLVPLQRGINYNSRPLCL